MSLDPKIKEAIQTAVRAVDQGDLLSRELVAWFDAVSSGNEKLTDRESTDRRLERLYGDTVLPKDEGVDSADGELEEKIRKMLADIDLGDLGADGGVEAGDADRPDGSRSDA